MAYTQNIHTTPRHVNGSQQQHQQDEQHLRYLLPSPPHVAVLALHPAIEHLVLLTGVGEPIEGVLYRLLCSRGCRCCCERSTRWELLLHKVMMLQ